MIRNQINNNDVLYRLVEGKSFQIIADELGVSKTTISNVIKKIEKEDGEKKLETALEIGAAVKKSGSKVTQILSRTRTCKILEKLNLDDDDTHDLLSKIIPKIDDKTKASELFDAAKIVLDLRESTGITHDEIENYCNTKKHEIVSLNEQLKDAKEKTAQSVSFMNHTLKENNITVENLNNYVKSRDYLKENGADVDDLPAVTNMVKTSSKNKHDPETTIAQLSENQSLKQRNTDLIKRNKQILEQNQAQIKEKQKQDDIMEVNRHILEPIEKFEKIHVTSNHLLILYGIVVEIGVKCGISTFEIIEKITRDIKTQYEQKIGFENELNIIRQDINSEKLELEKIVEDKIRLFTKVKVLRKEKTQLEATIDEYHEVIIKTFKNTMSKQQNDLANFVQYHKELLDSLFKISESKIIKMLENLKDENTRNKQSVDNIISEISEIFEEFGRYKYLQTLSNTARGEGTPSEMYSSMIIMVTGLERWIVTNNIDDWSLSNALASLKKQLEAKMKKNAQAA